MSELLQDLRFGARTFIARPAFSAVAVLTLALGIGSVVTVVTVAKAVLVEDLPYPRPDRLVLLTGVNRAQPPARDWPISYLDFVDWRRAADGAFADLAAHTNPRSFNLLSSDGEPERVSGEMVSASYFRQLGVEPALGRLFTEEEDGLPASERAALVSWELWQRRFGADAPLDGQTLTLNDESYPVVGVLPAGFRGLTDEAQVWVPVVMASTILGPHYIEARTFRWLTVLGRLAPGVTVEQAQAALDAATAALEESHPDTNQGIGARVAPLAEAWFGDLRPALVNLLAGAGFVLLIACANVANLLLVRAAARRREVAMRQALGAGRGRLMRQLLTESALLAAVGGGVGVLLALAATRAVEGSGGLGLKSFVELRLDPAVLGVALGVSALCVLLFGAVPAWIGSRADLSRALKQGGAGAGGRRHRLARALVVVEVWLAVFLLAAAGLAIRGFEKLRATDLGFETSGLLALRTDLQGPRWADPEAKRQLIRELLPRIEALPGIGEAALAGPVIPTDDWVSAPVTIEEWTGPGAQDLVTVNVHSVSPGYFAALGVPLAAGRDFTLDDTFEAPYVAVVSQALARRYWPGEGPLGKRLKFGPRQGETPWFTVVGVVGDVRHLGLAAAAETHPDAYFSILHIPPFSPPILNLLVRPEAGPEALSLAAPVREELRALAPALPVYDARTMEQRLSGQVSRDRFLVGLASAFAALALLIAAVGLYGVLSYTVEQQRREIGIRMALGAERRRLAGRVLRGGALLAAAGLVLGTASALAARPLLARWLHGLETADPLGLQGAAAVLLAVALAASYLPARRASRVDPMKALRAE